jgi:hypothetical protein
LLYPQAENADAHTSYWLLEQKVKNLQAFSEKTVDKRKKK